MAGEVEAGQIALVVRGGSGNDAGDGRVLLGAFTEGVIRWSGGFIQIATLLWRRAAVDTDVGPVGVAGVVDNEVTVDFKGTAPRRERGRQERSEERRVGKECRL